MTEQVLCAHTGIKGPAPSRLAPLHDCRLFVSFLHGRFWRRRGILPTSICRCHHSEHIYPSSHRLSIAAGNGPRFMDATRTRWWWWCVALSLAKVVGSTEMCSIHSSLASNEPISSAPHYSPGFLFYTSTSECAHFAKRSSDV